MTVKYCRLLVLPTGTQGSKSEQICWYMFHELGKGYKVRTNFKSRNPRNLEMLNIAHRDMGWAAGPPNQETRFVPFHKQVGHSEDGMRLAVTNLPAQNSYHTVEIIRYFNK